MELSLRRLQFAVCIPMLKLLLVACALIVFSAAKLAHAESLNWSYPGATVSIAGSSSSTSVNGVTVTSSGVVTGSFTTSNIQILGTSSSNGSSTGIGTTSMDATNDDMSSHLTYTVQFSEPVYNVSFTVLDIDGGQAFTAGNWHDIVDFSSDNGFPTASITNSSWVSYNSATGRADAISNANAVSGNANQSFGNIRVTFPGPITTFSVRHYAAPLDSSNDPAVQVIYIDDVTFTRSPRLAISKTSVNGTGTFSFSNSNGFTFTSPSTYTYGSTTTSVTTTAPNSPVIGSASILGVVGTATTITETGPSNWVVTSSTASCSDSNSVNSGNPATFSVAVSNNAFTIPATNVRAGAVLTCALTNNLKPTVSVQKVTMGGTGGPFSFSSSNLSSSVANISTSSAGTATPSSPTQHIAVATGSAVSISEGGLGTAWVIGSVTCNDANSASTGNTNPVASSTTSSVTIPGAAVVAGAAINCTFTNDAANPALSVAKSWAFATPAGDVNGNGLADVGDQIVYTYLVNNTGNINLSNVVITDIHEGTALPTTPVRVVTNETLISNGSSGTSTDTAINGSWDLITPGSQIRFRYTHTVNQTEFDGG
jgi:uncharacterized repeat protein (TIGR01451 family)